VESAENMKEEVKKGRRKEDNQEEMK